jgi:23S rRNA (uracil1939-C5)-methyltransferase
MGRAAVALPPGTFLQATGRAEEVLSDAVVRLVGKAKRVADLFCGIGPFALRLAESAQVFAADADGAAIQALDTALQATPGLRRLGAEKRDLYRDPLVAEEMSRFEAIVLDPPRAGAEAQCREIARSEVKRVVMVSCDPGTFARDARILCEAGFVAGEVTPVDQFRYSAHVEVVAGFRRGKRG